MYESMTHKQYELAAVKRYPDAHFMNYELDNNLIQYIYDGVKQYNAKFNNKYGT